MEGNFDESQFRLELARSVELFSKYAMEWFLTGSKAEKRLIAHAIGSNFVLSAKKLSIEAAIPFEEGSNFPQFRVWSNGREDVGTRLSIRPELKNFISMTGILAKRSYPERSEGQLQEMPRPAQRGDVDPGHLAA